MLSRLCYQTVAFELHAVSKESCRMFFKKQFDDNSITGSRGDHLDKDECGIELACAFPVLKSGRRLRVNDSPFIQ